MIPFTFWRNILIHNYDINFIYIITYTYFNHSTFNCYCTHPMTLQ